MRRMLLLSLVLIGCQDSTGPEDTMRLLSANERHWQMLGIRDYDYAYGFVAMVSGPPVRVEVRGGRVFRVVDLNSGREAGTCCTIDELFAHIHAAAEAGELIRVNRYDALGFPTVTLIGTPENDGGYTLTASNFVRR